MAQDLVELKRGGPPAQSVPSQTPLSPLTQQANATAPQSQGSPAKTVAPRVVPSPSPIVPPVLGAPLPSSAAALPASSPSPQATARIDQAPHPKQPTSPPAPPISPGAAPESPDSKSRRLFLPWPLQIPLEFQRYIMPGGIAVITLVIAALVFIGFQRGRSRAPSPTPTPPLAIEGEVLNETPSASPSFTPAPTVFSRQSTLKGDSQETITATSQTVLQVLSAIASKTRPPRQLTELVFPGLAPEDLSRSLSLDSLVVIPPTATSTLLSAATSTTLSLYFHTQEERFSTTTHATRLVALLQDALAPGPVTRNTLESTLVAIKENLWLGIPGKTQATLDFQETLFAGVTIRYLNFANPDLTLDYAFVPKHNALVVTTSREAMFAVLERLMR